MMPCVLCKREFEFKLVLITHPNQVLLCKKCASHVKGVGIQYAYPTGDFFLLTPRQYKVFMEILTLREMVDELMANVVADRLEGK
jgi:hypothetical protein